MNTPAVNNPASICSSPAPGKSSNAGNSDVAFDQVLSREVADRKSASASDSNAAGPNEASPAAPPSQPNAKPATAKKSDEKSDDGEPAETADAAQADSSAQAQTTATQLLALVADLGRLKPAADSAAPKADATSIAAAGKGGALLAGVRDTTTATGAGKDAAFKPQTDFEAALKSGADARQAPDLRASNGTDARIDSRAASTSVAALATDLKAQDGQAALPAIDLGALKVKEMPATIAAGMAPLQQAAFNVQALAVHPTDKLTPQVGTAGWDQALGQKVVWMVAGAQQSATLSLNPPDLGPLQIVLNVSNSQATATFTAAQPEVRQALEAALPRLREMLGDAGIQLGQATVGSGNPNSNWGSGNEQSQHGTARSGESAGDALATPLRTSRIQAISGGLGLVDTFA